MEKSVLIVGGGIIGLMSAWRLARAGHSVSVLEKNKACGQESTCAAIGALMPLPPDKTGEMAEFQRHSHALYPLYMQELAEEVGKPHPYKVCHRVQVLRSGKEAQQARALAERYPDSIRYLDEVSLKEEEPYVQSLGFGALYCMDTSYVNPNHLMKFILQGIEKLNVNVFCDVVVEGLAYTGKTFEVSTSRGTFYVDDVVIAGGIGSTALADAVPVAPVKGQCIDIMVDRPIISHLVRHQGLYIVQEESGLVRIGATSEPKAHHALPDREGYEALLQKAYEVLPVLKEGQVRSIWTGMRPKGPEGKFYIEREASAAGAIVATGHYKVGVGLAPATAEKVCSLVACTQPKHLQSS